MQWRARLWQVAEDKATILLSCKLGGDMGSFVARDISNQIAKKYMNKMVETCSIRNNQEKLNAEIFQQTARDLNMDPDSVPDPNFS